MSVRKRRRQAYYAALNARQEPQEPRANPFLCSWCGEPASERHYDRESFDHVASFCPTHVPDVDSQTAVILAHDVPKNTAKYPADSDSTATVGVE